MSLEKLPNRHHEVLKAIYDHIEEFGSSPYRNNIWIAERTHYEGNHITNIKRELRKNYRYLDDQVNLTPAGQAYIRQYFGAFVVKAMQLFVQGTVSAGPSESTLINYSSFDIPSGEQIRIPHTLPDNDVFALKVVGQSMVALGILDGDYVVVEKQDSLWWPSRQDMIVTRYLPHDPDRRNVENVDDTEYIGPVVKIYQQRFGEKGCELGWREANEINQYLIRADDLKPIGKVIAVYRKIVGTQ